MQEITLTKGQHIYYGRIVTKLNQLKGKIKSIYLDAIRNKLPHSFILEAIKRDIYENKVYKSLPAIYRKEIDGYYWGMGDFMFMSQLEWVLYYDGKYIGNNKRHSVATNKMYKHKKFDNNKVQGFHVYIGTENKY